MQAARAGSPRPLGETQNARDWHKPRLSQLWTRLCASYTVCAAFAAQTGGLAEWHGSWTPPRQPSSRLIGLGSGGWLG